MSVKLCFVSSGLRSGRERVLAGAGGGVLRPPGPLREQGPPSGRPGSPVGGDCPQTSRTAPAWLQGLLLQEDCPETAREML